MRYEVRNLQKCLHNFHKPKINEVLNVFNSSNTWQRMIPRRLWGLHPTVSRAPECTACRLSDALHEPLDRVSGNKCKGLSLTLHQALREYLTTS